MGILIAVLGIWFSSSLVKGDSKAVTTSLTTKWFSTPLLLETRQVHSGFSVTNHNMLRGQSREFSFSFVSWCFGFCSPLIGGE